MRRNTIVIVMVILLAVVAVYQNREASNKQTILPTEQAPKVKFLAPAFALSALDGQEYKVGGPRDKPLLVNFWASWCGPCAAEAPDLVKLYDKYKDQLDLYAVNVTQGDKIEDVKKFAAEYKYPFPVLLDKKGDIANLYRFIVIPTSFFIDKNGVIQEVINVVPSKELEKKIKKLINS